MGWKERGKYGVSTGRTVRSPFADTHGCFCTIPRRETETLLKFTRGTEKFSSSEMDEFLAENDIGDGLGYFAESSRFIPWNTRDSTVHRTSVPYSLKKRKRWKLSELAMAMENSVRVELNDSLERQNVTFIHRRVQKNLDADCIAIQKTKRNEVFTPRKRRYTRVQDLLKKCDKNELEPEVGYEISYRYPRNEYYECSELHYFRYRWSFQQFLFSPYIHHKARSKIKGVKNKGLRWDMYSDAEVKSGKMREKEPCYCEIVDQGYVESKIKVIDAKSFSEWKALC